MVGEDGARNERLAESLEYFLSRSGLKKEKATAPYVCLRPRRVDEIDVENGETR